MNGITLNGVHSSTIPVEWKTVKRPYMPTPKTFTQEAPEADSEYDFSEFNDDSRLHYFDRVFEGTLSVVGKNMTQVNILLTKLARWLIGGWKTLEFDDMPGTLWTVKVENPEQVSHDLGKIGVATVYFRTKPFSKWILNSNSGGIPLDSKVMIDSNIPLDMELNSVYSFVAENQTFTVDNIGDWYSRPVITITGSFTTVTVGIGNRVYTYTGNIQAGDTLVFDCKKGIVTKNGTNAMPNTSGDRFEFSPGENILIINSNGTGQATVLFDFNFINMAVI